MKLIEINLLPKREEASKLFMYITSSVALIGLIGTGALLVMTNNITTENETKQGTLQQLQSDRTELETRLNGLSSSNSVQVLEKTIGWTKTYPIKTMDVMDRITALLPKRGFVENYTYNEVGSVEINVQFDTKTDAVFFLARLKEETWVSDVKMPSITSKSATTQQDTAAINELPRYIAPYTITLNYEKLNALQYKKKGGVNEE